MVRLRGRVEIGPNIRPIRELWHLGRHRLLGRDAVDVVVRQGTLVATPVRRVRGGHDLRELVSRIPKDYKPEEVDWGPPVGREVW